MKEIKITWSDFPDPCYVPQERWGDCPATFGELINDERIPVNDLIWAFCYCTLIPDNTKRIFAVRCVRETPIGDGKFVVDLITDQRSLTALDVAWRHAHGEATDEELDAAGAAARDTAWTAAEDAARAAARAAAWDAARAAARAAAEDAARAAAWAAARDAAWNAARTSARDAQIEIIKSML